MITTHIAGQHVTINDRYLRQRCAWCGHILLDYDLHRVAVPTGQEGPPATWPVGALVTVDGGASWTTEVDKLPDDACARRPATPEMVRCPRCKHPIDSHWADDGRGQPGCHGQGCLCSYDPDQIARMLGFDRG